MTIRSDIVIDWSVSPRTITVLSPSVELTIQDMIDTLRTLEASSAGMDEPYILDASGGEALDVGFVGLTTQLKNAVLCFEGRASSPWVACKVTGGNLTAVDENGLNIYPIEGTPYVNVSFIQDNSASIVHVDSGGSTSGVTAEEVFNESLKANLTTG